MYHAKKPILSSLNEHLICKLCKGYFIDATTIIECLHTFCRSCIVKYLETTKYCPVCDVQVHKAKPLLNLRSDKIIQDLVYKIVPRLFNNELQRRKEYYKKLPEGKPSLFEEIVEASYHSILSPEEELCVTLNYYGSIAKPRYLRCPSAVSIMHLQKLIRAKFDLSDSHHIDVLHNQDCLNPCYTLMDLVYIYKLSKMESIDLTYRIYEYMAKKLKIDNNEKTKETNESSLPSNNNNWKEVQLRISENGEMSITGIQDSITTQNYTSEMIKVIDVKSTNKKKELPDLKYIGKTSQLNKNANSSILSEEMIISDNKTEQIISNSIKKDICNVVSAVTVPCINATTTTTVFSTINSMKCSVGTSENNLNNDNNIKPLETTKKEDVKLNDRGIKRKHDHVNNVSKKNDTTNKKSENKPIQIDIKSSKNSNIIINDNQLINKTNEIKTNVEIEKLSTSKETNSNSNTLNEREELVNAQNTNNSNHPATPKPSTKYQGTSQPCYMSKNVYSPVINVPKPIQIGSPSKSDKNSFKSASNVKNDLKSVTTLSPSSVSLNPLANTQVTASKINMSPKSKSNTPMGYKTLRDPPKSWCSQISKANLSKPQPDPKYSDSKNPRPPKFFKMRNNNMLRFLGNPASGVKPMYSVHVSPEKEKQPEKIVENREIKKHSIVKIDPKTLKPISEKAPETTSLSSQVSASSDLKINTSSVSIFNPLKLQSSSPKSDRKSPKSPQSPKTKTNSSTSPPVLKRDKPNLNFTPPNPFIPNLSSQTVNPNQFLCNSGPPGFPSYDPRVMVAYHNLLYGPTMGFPHTPLPYHLGGLDINQRGKSFDISKIVGMQQQTQSSKSPVSPQGTSKLESPPLPPPTPPPPPQVTYQSRPTLKPQNSTTKRPPKDHSKNEKSLQNTVEKLTLSRAKEIHKAAEILNKIQSSSSSSSNSTIEDDKKPINDKAEKIEEKEEVQIVIPPSAPSTDKETVVQNSNNEKTSQESSVIEETPELKKETKETDNPVSDKNKDEVKETVDLKESENSDSKLCEKSIEVETKCSEKVPVSDNENTKKDNVKDTNIEKNQDCSPERTSEQKESVNKIDNKLGTSDDSKNNNETKKETGSDELETVTGDK